MIAEPVPIAPTTEWGRPLGQVFTPMPVAEWMVSWACAGDPRRILDPAMGRGVFIEALERLVARRSAAGLVRVDACEIDSSMLRRGRPRFTRLEVRCRCEDFITADFRRGYDAIIANPPYVRHHALAYGESMLQVYDRLCGRRLSRMTNLYGYFLVRIWSLLAEHGRAAVITPAEWLNADFGVALKAYLLEQNAIEAILQFDHSAGIFDGAITTAAIILLRRGRAADEPIRLLNLPGPEALAGLSLGEGRALLPGELVPSAKWTPLFGLMRQLVSGGPTLGDVAVCTRGIATGANSYFVLRESQRRHLGISHADLVPCIAKARHVRGGSFRRSDLKKLIDGDEPVFLLRPRARLSPPVRRYLAEGLRQEIHHRYLPSHRPVWFRPERRQPAPILVSVFARGSFRFVRNYAGSLHLTAYHGIYPRDASRGKIQAILDCLARKETQEALADHRRVYGGGLLKVEPRDVEALAIPPELYRVCGGASPLGRGLGVEQR